MKATVLRHISKPFITVSALATKPYQLLITTPIISIPAFCTSIRVLLLLGLLFLLDFITGIVASYVEFKKSKNNDCVPKRYVIQSSKLRLSAVKFITYGLAILIAYALEWVFLVSEFEIHKNINKLSLSTTATAFFCLIEFYSIFFENVKRMGFDIIEIVKTISKKCWDIYKTIKNEKHESSESN